MRARSENGRKWGGLWVGEREKRWNWTEKRFGGGELAIEKRFEIRYSRVSSLQYSQRGETTSQPHAQPRSTHHSTSIHQSLDSITTEWKALVQQILRVFHLIPPQLSLIISMVLSSNQIINSTVYVDQTKSNSSSNKLGLPLSHLLPLWYSNSTTHM